MFAGYYSNTVLETLKGSTGMKSKTTVDQAYKNRSAKKEKKIKVRNRPGVF